MSEKFWNDFKSSRQLGEVSNNILRHTTCVNNNYKLPNTVSVQQLKQKPLSAKDLYSLRDCFAKFKDQYQKSKFVAIPVCDTYGGFGFSETFG